jgi:hypothetical protein
VLVFTIVPAAMIKSLSADIAIGGTCIAPAVALSKPAGRHCDVPARVTVRRAEVALVTPLASIGSARVTHKK